MSQPLNVPFPSTPLLEQQLRTAATKSNKRRPSVIDWSNWFPFAWQVFDQHLNKKFEFGNEQGGEWPVSHGMHEIPLFTSWTNSKLCVTATFWSTKPLLRLVVLPPSNNKRDRFPVSPTASPLLKKREKELEYNRLSAMSHGVRQHVAPKSRMLTLNNSSTLELRPLGPKTTFVMRIRDILQPVTKRISGKRIHN